MCTSDHRGQMALLSWKLELQMVVSCLTLVLRTELRGSEKSTTAGPPPDSEPQPQNNAWIYTNLKP